MTARHPFLAVVRHVVCWFALALAFAIPLAVPTDLRALDFAAFYCAGEAVAQHADPYRVMPLGACERRIATNGPIAAGAVIPAPLPPYALNVFSILARLPFPIAQHIFDLLSIGAFAASTLLLRSVTRRPIIEIAYALAPLGWIVLIMGQTVLLILGSLAAACFALNRGHDRWAALCGCGMMIDPHLGLPVCASLFLCVPRTRLTLIIAAMVIFLASLIATPLNITIEYVTEVIPLHAISEAAGATQISLTSLLTFVGVPNRAALAIGGVQYAVTIALGMLAARRFPSPAALLVIPSLSALVGGTFLHGYDLLLGVPAALFLWNRQPLLAVLAIIAISPHWLEVGGVLGPYIAIASAVILISSVSSLPRAFLAIPPLVLVLVVHPHSISMGKFAMSGPPSAYVERSWSAWEVANARGPTWPIKNTPAWIGIITLYMLTLRCFVGARNAQQPSEPGDTAFAQGIRTRQMLSEEPAVPLSREPNTP